MDNLSVHKAKIVLQLFDPHFDVMFLPTYSSQLNPIESVWNVIKHEWRKTQHMHALLEFDDQKERTKHSIGRLQAIIGKEVFNMNRFTLTAEDEEDRSLPSSVHGSLHQRNLGLSLLSVMIHIFHQ